MTLVEQWRDLLAALPDGWSDARVLLTVPDERRAARAAALLAPVYAGHSGSEVRFSCARVGQGPRPDTVRRLLRRIDRERIVGTLELVEAGAPVPAEVVRDERESLASSWSAQVAALPPDWSDAYAEILLRSGGQFERAALLTAPLNPSRAGLASGFRFRCARRFGYGASPEMVRRCLERLDAEVIHGEVRILHALSDTKPVATQGPVWYLGGRPA